ncbi:hypothetical protein [Pseudomonas sp. 6D_7.1_Bac1]|uniref:hypothetical protein n=1 Tax=Pseudomonas sp. 6D_7.1_Bac1 TaxID=2971615 RepID=UPI0021C7C512|nr:hypothetical protein [Pseudomonas sp. 6D_7.1_Bac1]MCU1751986.1 hypothetical protein [Pseudomonas sp. 6D_7.1_Bac1]
MNTQKTTLTEKIRSALLIPSRSQWAKWKLLSKLTAVGTLLGFIGVGLTIYTLLPSTPQEPLKKAYDLSDSRRKDFLELLQITQSRQFDTLKIGCVAWSEKSCLAAGKFLILFSEAGWKIESDRVYKMEPNIPSDGMTIATRGEDIANLPKLAPHLGRWSSVDQSQAIISMAFKYMDNPVKSSSDPSLPPNTLGIYFGPEPSLIQTITRDQKNVRKPLIGFLSAASSVVQACSLDQNEKCISALTLWDSEVFKYLREHELDSTAVNKWQHLSAGTEAYSIESIEKKKDLLIRLFFGLG